MTVEVIKVITEAANAEKNHKHDYDVGDYICITLRYLGLCWGKMSSQ